MAGVEFRKVSKRFGTVEALIGLDLVIRSGEFVSLLGPSGSGKTTTLNLLAGLLPLDEGDVLIGDRRVNDVSPDKRDIAMVFQNYALYPHMTIFENLAFPLRARGRRPGEHIIRDKVARIAEMLGVEQMLERYPKELSGGQQQRVALGRAIIREPRVLLLDEPLSNLDARLRIRMRHHLKALHDTLQSTVVYVTHDQAEALTLSTRIAVFDRGRLQQYGTPREIYSRPVNMFVANFVGDREMCFLEGILEARGDRPWFRGTGVSFPLAPAGSATADAGRRVSVGVRAEGIAVHLQQVPDGIPAEVSQLELAGPDLLVYARIGPGLEVCCRAGASLQVQKGDPVHLAFLPEHLHLFDPETGRGLPRGIHEPARESGWQEAGGQSW